MRVSFVVMPFGGVNRPALGVSLLKSQLLTKLRIDAKIHYFNIDFAERAGVDLYNQIAEGGLSHLSLLGEMIFAQYAFTNRTPNKNDIDEMQSKIFSTGYSKMKKVELYEQIKRLIEIIPNLSELWMKEIQQTGADMIGFTSSFHQNCASIFMSKKIKEKMDIPIIFGGSNCEGEMGYTLVKNIPYIDYICSGEGDKAFIKLIENLLNNTRGKINGIITRESTVLETHLTDPILDMSTVAIPNFDDYFDRFNKSNIGDLIAPKLVVESSRGCWWGEKSQCKFCGLNGSTMRYRSKTVPQMIDEIMLLVKRYNVKNVEFVDNILDMKYIMNFFPELSRRNMDLEIFYDTKSNLTYDQLKIMKSGGLSEIQPGIESLSDNVLRLIKKGVTFLQNVQTLKFCTELNILPHWNIIWGFPKEDPEDYAEMAKIVPSLVHLVPPDVVIKVSLDRFSPYFEEHQANGIKNIRPMDTYYKIYPFEKEDVKKVAYHFDFDYVEESDPTVYVKALRSEVKIWWTLWQNGEIPKLRMIELEDAIIVADCRPCSKAQIFNLTGKKAVLYKACKSIQSFNVLFYIINKYFECSKDELSSTLEWFVKNNLLLKDKKNNFLSLALSL